jgi:hypothetical protein
MYISTQDHKPDRPRLWSGTPTRRSQMAEFVLGFFPTWVGLFGISVALLLPLIQSCREWARDQAGKPRPQMLGSVPDRDVTRRG